MAIITLTTDFGTKDYFVAAIKGRILSQIPDATVVDISHNISPFDVYECAYILKNAVVISCPHFCGGMQLGLKN